MFTYCGNNPATGVDQSGHAWCKISFDAFNPFDSGLVPIIGGGGSGYMGVVQAMNDSESEMEHNIDELYAFVTNSDEARVWNAEHFAFYQGVLVVRLPWEWTAFSFGVIVLGSQYKGDNFGNTTLKHEYGHFLQLKKYGWYSYLSTVAIPSLMFNILDRKGMTSWSY